MEKRSLASLPQVRALGRHTGGRDPLTLFYTASGIECLFTGSELHLCLNAGFDLYEPWISVELNGAWIARFPVPAGESEVCLFRGMTPGRVKHVRVLKDVQAMHDDPGHFLQVTGLAFADGGFLPLPEPACRLEFVGNSITSGEGALGARCEEDWISPFFSAVNHYARMTADALGAEWRIVSQSGWGLLSSWDNDPRCRLMDHYDAVCGLAAGAGLSLCSMRGILSFAMMAFLHATYTASNTGFSCENLTSVLAGCTLTSTAESGSSRNTAPEGYFPVMMALR